MTKTLKTELAGIAAMFVTALSLTTLAQAEQRSSSGRAPCTISDGYQTVHFSDGASYSGEFKDCAPQSGPGVYVFEGHSYSGNFMADGNKVTLIKDGAVITLWVEG